MAAATLDTSHDLHLRTTDTTRDMRPAPLNLVTSPVSVQHAMSSATLDSPFRTNSHPQLGAIAALTGLSSPMYSPPPAASAQGLSSSLVQSLGPVPFPTTSLPIPMTTNAVKPVPTKAVGSNGLMGFGICVPLQAVGSSDAPMSGQSTVSSSTSGGAASGWGIHHTPVMATSPSSSWCEPELAGLTTSLSALSFSTFLGGHGGNTSTTPPPSISPSIAAQYTIPSTLSFGALAVSPTNPDLRSGARAPVPATPPRGSISLGSPLSMPMCVTPMSLPGSPAMRGTNVPVNGPPAHTLSPLPSPGMAQRFRTQNGDAKRLW